MSFATAYESLSSDLRKVFEGAIKACPRDITLLVEEEEIPVHKFILAARSKYFNHLFNPEEGFHLAADQGCNASGSEDIEELDDVSQSNQQSLVEISDITVQLTDNVIELRNEKVEVVKAILVFIYQARYDLNGEVETHLQALKLAHLFKMEGLIDILINHLVEFISLDNFVDFYNINMCSKNVQMESSCFNFLKENGEEVAKSPNFSKLTLDSLLSILDVENFVAAEVDIFRAAERWAGVNKPNQETVKEIVKKIRLATISQVDLFDVVRPSKDLPFIDILEPIESITKKDAASTNFRLEQCIPVASTNVVLQSKGATVTGGDIEDEDTMDCIDGNVGSSYAYVEKDSPPLLITLGQQYRLSSVRVRVEGSSYTIESSPDGESWQQVGFEAEVMDEVVWRTFEFRRRIVRHFRITCNTGKYDTLYVYHLESPARSIANTN